MRRKKTDCGSSRTMRKFIAILLLVIMALYCAAIAFAEDSTTIQRNMES